MPAWPATSCTPPPPWPATDGAREGGGPGASASAAGQAVEVVADRPLYEEIGRSYSTTRREDPRIAAEIVSCLGPGRSVVNVGAGTGSYEPVDRVVVAVEPAWEMVRQRRGRTRRVVRGVAEALPFPDAAFDAGMAVLTIHHWGEPEIGLRELRRVSRRQVVFFFEPLRTRGFWALDYFPEALEVPSEQDPPGEEAIRAALPVQQVRPVLVPHDCIDGFGAAFWARPEAYLDPQVQAGMSWLALLTPEARRRGTDRLASDLASGAWDRRHGHLRHLPTWDAGYRIAIAE
jgi:SAM-dependent methyltransferase